VLKINLTSESVFYTLQGEGKYSGVPSVFVRLSNCNLRCKWTNKDGTESICDTPHSSYRPERNLFALEDVVKKMMCFGDVHWVVTGGEPLLQLDAVYQIAEACKTVLTIETNGTIPPDMSKFQKSTLFSISPKLGSAGASVDQIESCVAGTRHIARSGVDLQVKYVLNSENDVTEILDFVDRTKVPRDQIILMPQGSTEKEIDTRMLMVAEVCKRHSFRMSDRVHLRLWKGALGT
jgi:7-carboxy-7-deazaguanine synthase